MKRKHAEDLDVGEKIEIPTSLLSSKAVIKSMRYVPCPKGQIVVLDVEVNEGPVTGKGTFGFPTDYNVGYYPEPNPLWWRALMVLMFPIVWLFPGR